MWWLTGDRRRLRAVATCHRRHRPRQGASSSGRRRPAPAQLTRGPRGAWHAARVDDELEPLYEPDGDRYVPSPYTRSPWSPDAQHGGAPAALLVGAIERHGDGGL